MNKYKSEAVSDNSQKGKAKQNNRHFSGNGNGTFHNRKRRQQEAEQRAEQRTLRSPQQQLTKLDEGGFTAKRERARLERYTRGFSQLKQQLRFNAKAK